MNTAMLLLLVLRAGGATADTEHGFLCVGSISVQPALTARLSNQPALTGSITNQPALTGTVEVNPCQ